MTIRDLSITNRYKPRFALLYLHGPILERTLEIRAGLSVVPYQDADSEVRDHYEFYRSQRGQPSEGQIVLPFDILTEPTAVVVLRHEALKPPQDGLHDKVSPDSLALNVKLVSDIWFVAYMMGIVRRRPIRKFLSTIGASETGGPSRGERSTTFGDLLMWRDPSLYASEWNTKAGERLIELDLRFNGLSEDLQSNLNLPLERLNAAMDPGREIQRRAVDLGLSLEGLLTDSDEQARGPTLALRGAWLLSKNNVANRVEFHKQMKVAYRMRNDAVHAHKNFNSRDAEQLLPQLCGLVADLIENRIDSGEVPDWDKLVLGDTI